MCTTHKHDSSTGKEGGGKKGGGGGPHIAVAVDVKDDGVASLDLANQHLLSQAVLQQPHDGAPQRSRSVCGVVTLCANIPLSSLQHSLKPY